MAKHDGSTRRMITAFVAGAVAVGLMGLFSGGVAIADHEPANKVAAAGTSVESFDDATPILSETVRVSSPADLILSVTLECSILTELTTGGTGEGGATDFAEAEGRVDIWIEVDGKPVPVSTSTASNQNRPGAVTFCNREYRREVTDEEDPQDGLDEEHDFIRTKDANSFNWLALNTGSTYDDLANGQNILEIVVWADYMTSTAGEAVADAFVGQRTLIAEPTNASIHETVDPSGQ